MRIEKEFKPSAKLFFGGATRDLPFDCDLKSSLLSFWGGAVALDARQLVFIPSMDDDMYLLPYINCICLDTIAANAVLAGQKGT